MAACVKSRSAAGFAQKQSMTESVTKEYEKSRKKSEIFKKKVFTKTEKYDRLHG